MRKSATLDRFAAYFDVGAATLRPVSSSSWDDVTPAQLTAVMEPGVRDPERVPTVSSDTFPGVPTSPAMEQAARRRYLLKPVRAFATYERKGKREALDSNAPAQRVHLRIDAVATRLTSSHLRAAFIAAERLERDARRAPHAHLRPTSAILSAEGSGAGSGAREWWRFAVAATTLRARREGTVPPRIDRLVVTMRARRRYVEAYAAHVASHARPKRKKGASGERWPAPVPVGKMPVLDDVERDVPARVCVLFRALAHARARREGAGKSASTAGAEDDAGEVARARGGWFGGWFARSRSSTPNDDDASCDAADDPDLDPDAEMSEEDWAQLRRVFDVEGHRPRGVEGVRGCERRASDGDHRSDRRGVVRARRRRRRSFDDGAARERLWTPRGLAIVPPGKIGSPRDARGDRCARRARGSFARRARDARRTSRNPREGPSPPTRPPRRCGATSRTGTRAAATKTTNTKISRTRRVRVRGDVDGRCGRERYASPVFRRARPSFGRASSWSRDKTHGSGCAGRHRLRLGGARARHRAQVADRSSGGGADTTQTCAVGGTGGAAQTSGGGGGEPTGHRRARAAARRARRSTRRGRHRRRPRAASSPRVGQHRIRPSDRVRGPRSGSTQSCAAVELGASAETSKLFNAFKISVADVSAAVAPGTVGSDCGVERVDVHGQPRPSSPRSARTRRFSRRSRPCRDTPRRR